MTTDAEARELGAAFRAIGRMLAREIAGQLLLELRPVLGAVAVARTPEPGEQLLDSKQTCERLHCARSTLQRHVERGELVPVKVGRALRFREADLAAFIRRLSGIHDIAGAPVRAPRRKGVRRKAS